METIPRTTLLADVKTHAALVVVQIAFASGAVEGKLAMLPVADGGGGVTPEALTMARMLGAAVFFQLLANVARLRVPTTAREQAQLAGLAILGIVLNQALFLAGLRLTSAFSAALLGVTIPVFTAALAVIFRQERASARTALGLALAIVGVVWLIGIHSVDPGAIIIAVNCLSYSFYLILSRRLIQKLGAITVITWLFTWGAVLFAPRRDGVRDDVRRVAATNELARRLKDADVRLHPEDDDRARRALPEGARDARLGARVERELVDGGRSELRELRRDRRDRRAEPLGYCSLAITVTPRRRAASRRRTAFAVRRSSASFGIADARRSCTSTTRRTLVSGFRRSMGARFYLSERSQNARRKDLRNFPSSFRASKRSVARPISLPAAS